MEKSGGESQREWAESLPTLGPRGSEAISLGRASGDDPVAYPFIAQGQPNVISFTCNQAHIPLNQGRHKDDCFLALEGKLWRRGLSQDHIDRSAVSELRPHPAPSYCTLFCVTTEAHACSQLRALPLHLASNKRKRVTPGRARCNPAVETQTKRNSLSINYALIDVNY